MFRSICPCCMKENNPNELSITESLIIRGETYSAKHIVESCDLCNETYNSKRCPEMLIPKCFDQYRAAHNYFYPKNLIEIQKFLNISDEEIASKLEMDISTLELLKTGALPSDGQNSKFWKFIQHNNYFDFISC